VRSILRSSTYALSSLLERPMKTIEERLPTLDRTRGSAQAHTGPYVIFLHFYYLYLKLGDDVDQDGISYLLVFYLN
jgi:hypothetical protein